MQNVVQIYWWFKDARDILKRLTLKGPISGIACNIAMLCAVDVAELYSFRRSLESRKEVRLAVLNAARAEMERVVAKF